MGMSFDFLAERFKEHNIDESTFSDIIYYLAKYGEQHKEIIQPKLVMMLYKVYVATNNLVIRKNRT